MSLLESGGKTNGHCKRGARKERSAATSKGLGGLNNAVLRIGGQGLDTIEDGSRGGEEVVVG